MTRDGQSVKIRPRHVSVRGQLHRHALVVPQRQPVIVLRGDDVLRELRHVVSVLEADCG